MIRAISALMGFGGAGPLHVNAVARLMGSWPAVSPVSPGVLCALGDATTRMRTETARSASPDGSAKRSTDDLIAILARNGRRKCRSELIADGIAAAEIETEFEVDVRYSGQAFEVPLRITLPDLEPRGLTGTDRPLRRRTSAAVHVQHGHRTRDS